MSLLRVRWDLDIVAQSSIVHRDDYSMGTATIYSLFRREDIIGAAGNLNDHRPLADEPPAPDYDGATSPLGRYSVETLRAGTRLQAWVRIDNATPAQAAFLATVLAAFAANGHFGGRAAAGHGHITATVERGEFSAGSVDWTGELHDHRDDAIEALSALS